MTGMALDKFDWQLGTHSEGYPADLERLIWPESSAMDARVFRRTDTSSWTTDPDRIAVLAGMIAEIRDWGLSPAGNGNLAGALRRFVQWVDQHSGAPLRRESIVPLLARYKADAPDRYSALRRAATALSLSEAERSVLFPPTEEAESLRDDDWHFAVEGRDGSSSEADFARLLIPGDAGMPHPQWRTVRQARLNNLDMTAPRACLIEALSNEFRARLTEQSASTASLKTQWQKLRRWIVWADDAHQTLSMGTAVKTLHAYTQHLNMQWRAGRLSGASVRQLVESPLQYVAVALNQPTYQIKLTLPLPGRKASGLTTKAADTAELKRYCANLHVVIDALPMSELCAATGAPKVIRLWNSKGQLVNAELPAPCGGYGATIDPRAAHRKLINLRIVAELHRFIAITGVNLSVARDLKVGQHTADAPVWKDRAGRYIRPRVGTVYSRRLEQHIQFLEACVPGGITPDTPMFPTINTNANTDNTLVAAARAGTLAWRTQQCTNASIRALRSWLDAADAPAFGTRILRRSKAEWLLRRYGGDPLQVSRDMGNTPEVVTSNYGGKGNLHWATLEWSQHWSAEQHSALAPGGCASPSHHEPIATDPAGGGCNEAACMGCLHYRGEDSMDYIHRLLSYQHVLLLRVAANPASERPIALIDAIVTEYLMRHPEQRTDVDRMREHIATDPHPLFATLIPLEELSWR